MKGLLKADQYQQRGDFANIPVVMTKGRLVCQCGDGKEQGDEGFALAGKINYSGLVEIPMGTPLKEIIEEIGGGIPNKRKFKAAQTGGPSEGASRRVISRLPWTMRT